MSYYGTVEYWEDRYSRVPDEQFEWLEKWAAI
jgi:hypothetical protein